MTPSLASVVFLQVGDEFLIIDRATLPFGWTLPGGRVDPGEEAIDAAAREMHEECGVLLDKSLLTFNGVFPSAHTKYLVHLYSCNLKEKPNVTIRESEVKSYRWIKTEHMNDFIWSGNSKTWIERLTDTCQM